MGLAHRLRASGAALAAALACACALIAARVPSMGDYEHELLPSLRELLGGDVSAFAGQAPIYGASAWPRLPFAWLADTLGAGDLGVYRAGVLACLLPLAALIFWLVRRMQDARRPLHEQAALAAVLLAAPVAMRALRDGHPEDVLAATLAVSAVLLALRSRAPLAGVALGLAIAFKPWAVVAAGPVLVAARERRLLICLCAAGAAALAWAPLQLLAQRHGQADVDALTLSARIFHPQQLLWPLGERHGNGGVVAPESLTGLVRPAIVLGAFALSLLWAWRRRATGSAREDALLLLALILLVRCAIDPWNNAYYAVPAVVSLGAWEALTRRGLPVASAAVLAFTWLSFVRLPMYLEPDGLALAYALWIVPVLAALAVRLYAPPEISSATTARTSPSSSSAPWRTSPGA
jgi:hypothetical protein